MALQVTYDGDRYLPVMKEFHAKASVRLAELEDLFIDMKARVRDKAGENLLGRVHNSI